VSKPYHSGPNNKYDLSYATGNFAHFKGAGAVPTEFTAEEIRGADVQLLCSSPDASKVYFAKEGTLRILDLGEPSSGKPSAKTIGVEGSLNPSFATCVFAAR